MTEDIELTGVGEVATLLAEQGAARRQVGAQHQRMYSDIEAFYSADERRRRSSEADYGCWWMEGTPRLKYRVSYVQATGEVYAVQWAGGRSVEVMGIVAPDEGHVYYMTLDGILEGWAERCGEPNGLQWVRERLRGAS